MIKAESEREDEQAMLARVYASQKGDKQTYRKRLRSAIYFEDSGSEGAPTGALVEDDTSDSSQHEVDKGWLHEPRHNHKDTMRRLQEHMNQTLEENRRLRQQVTHMMRILETHVQPLKQRVQLTQ